MGRYQLFIYTLLLTILLYLVVVRDLTSGFRTNGTSYKRVASSASHIIDNTTNASFLVLHVGPPKTASSTIQDSLDANENILASDNYVYLGLRNPTGRRDTFGVRSGLVQFRGQKKTTLLDKLQLQFEKFPKTHFIISNEGFSIMQGTTDKRGVGFFTLLKEKVKNAHRQVLVAVGYRRYFAWVVSVYNQQYKSNQTQQSFVAWYRANIHSRIMRQKSPLQVYSYMKKQFKNVTVINMHHESEDVMSQVYCDVLPNAPNTCKAYKERLASPNGDNKDIVVVRSNPSVPLWPRAVAREAQSRGLISLRTDRLRDLERQIAQHAKNINYTSFPEKCLSQQDLDYLLETSLSHEQQVLSDCYASPLGEEALRREFQIAVERNKFCSVDAKAVLSDEQWQLFFSKHASANTINS